MKYDFRCDEHGVFEVVQSMKDTTKTYPCPECNVEALKFIGSTSPVHFSGGGWPSKKPIAKYKDMNDYMTRKKNVDTTATYR